MLKIWIKNTFYWRSISLMGVAFKSTRRWAPLLTQPSSTCMQDWPIHFVMNRWHKSPARFCLLHNASLLLVSCPAVPSKSTAKLWSECHVWPHLLHPFWNHWLSLQCDWLSVVRFIHESYYIVSFAVNRIFFSANENGTLKQNN